MQSAMSGLPAVLAAGELPDWLYNLFMFIKVLIGFSIIIFVHELGHFLAAKWVGVRVDRFAVGFGTRVCGWRSGEGFTFGNRPELSRPELAERGWGETDYCLKALPLGGYVKMLGQDDIIIDEKTGDVRLVDDPRAFTSRPVGQRMIVVSAGVIFNLLFAAVLLMAVFLIGKKMPAPVIGLVPPDSTAQGKVLPGDRVLAINGQRVSSFFDIRQAAVLTEGPLRMKIERDGEELPEEVVIEPERDPSLNLTSIDFNPFMTTHRVRDGDPIEGAENVLKGDVIVAVDGRPVQDGLAVVTMFQQSAGRVLPVTVERRDPDSPDAPPRIVECRQRATLVVEPADPPGERAEGAAGMVDNSHLLGLLRRRAVNMVIDGAPADRAGLKRGDVIVRWGTIANPTYQEIIDSVTAEPIRPIDVGIERGSESLTLTITPEKPFRLFGESRPRVGVDFSWRGEEARPVVADVVPGTPAAALNIPRGALLTAVDGRPVRDWFEVAEALKAAAGRTIELRYRTGEDEVAAQMTVPGSVVNELDLPPGVAILSIDGQRSVRIRGDGDKERELALPGAHAVRHLLRTNVGRTVTIRYSPALHAQPVEAEFAVREDNIDPWQLRVKYIYDPFGFEVLTEVVSANGNPLVALLMGADYVMMNVRHIYAMLTQMAKQNVGVEHVAGPVGIIGIAIEQARLGWSELLFFLAILSINLAVINFLPMPVMDGGLMLFLIIEKIKGKPLSLKTQMISTLVGLAAIIMIALFVTIQDISRFF